MSMEPDNEAPVREKAAGMSRTPSWVMLGFVLGAAFVWLLPKTAGGRGGLGREEPPAKAAAKPAGAQPARPAAAAPVAAKPAPRQLSVVEAVFEEHGKNAIWDRNRTEVAVWNSDKAAFCDYYEAYRDEGTVWFRSIPVLTRPLLALAGRSDVPIVFTETEEMRKEREAARRLLVPARVETEVTTPKPIVEAPGQ